MIKKKKKSRRGKNQSMMSMVDRGELKIETEAMAVALVVDAEGNAEPERVSEVSKPTVISISMGGGVI
jgi:hypothetical protein